MFARGLFSRKQKESASVPGWKLFGKVPPRESPPKDSKTIQQVSLQSHTFLKICQTFVHVLGFFQDHVSDLVVGGILEVLLSPRLSKATGTCVEFALKRCLVGKLPGFAIIQCFQIVGRLP